MVETLPSKLFLADILPGKTDRLGGIMPKSRPIYFSSSWCSSFSFPIRLRRHYHRQQESDAKHGILFYVAQWEEETYTMGKYEVI